MSLAIFFSFYGKVSGADLTYTSQICPCLELSISRQPLSVRKPISRKEKTEENFSLFSYQQLNSKYPARIQISISITVQKVFSRNIVINIPIATKNSANPATRFIYVPRFKHFLYFQFMQAFCSYACPFLSASASLSISFTSFSVTVFSPLDLKRSITSGTISRIFVIVS